MAKRRKSKSKSGGFLAGLIFIAAVSAGGWYLWKSGKLPEIPTWGGTNQNGAKPAGPAKGGSKPFQAPVSAPVVQAPVAKAEPVQPTNSPPPQPVGAERLDPPEHQLREFRTVRNALDAQIALARIGISVGPIDGVPGNNMRRALLAWQIHNGLPVSGELDAESKAALLVEEPLFTKYVVTEADLARLKPVPAGWLAKSQADRLDYESVLEMAAERGRASVSFVRKLNPQVNWNAVTPGTVITLPRVDAPPVRERAAFVRVHLYSKTLDVFGQNTNLIAHYPCSIAAKVEKRPIGRLEVTKVALNPNYLFDPDVFSESAEARKIGRKLTIPPGPNGPVGTAWIGLSRSGYGIHGTPQPEQVGRTESHGCFRLANWNAEHLLQLIWKGCPVYVEP